ncbi:MAG: hypothetical protein MI924_18710 [Chloroflexales bacterium]|nr:hypothetical protein [Chloroflexales bacterium]
MTKKTRRNEIIRLVDRIRSAPESDMPDEELDELVLQLERSVAYPRIADLIYWPNLLGFERSLTSEEIADFALNHESKQDAS